MEKENLEKLFENLKERFDFEEPETGHENRFLRKLSTSKGVTSNTRDKDKKSWWKPLSIAASIAILCMLGFGIYGSLPTLDEQVAEISPEVSRTQFYFAGLIKEQVKALENESTPETRQIIDDTMLQLENLETGYARMEQDLIQGGNGKLILNAMITNFRTRIDLLQEVLEKMDTINNLKNNDGTETTI